jgi:hypothetical protein
MVRASAATVEAVMRDRLDALARELLNPARPPVPRGFAHAWLHPTRGAEVLGGSWRMREGQVRAVRQAPSMAATWASKKRWLTGAFGATTSKA